MDLLELKLNLMLQREQWYKEKIMSEANRKFIQAMQSAYRHEQQEIIKEDNNESN